MGLREFSFSPLAPSTDLPGAIAWANQRFRDVVSTQPKAPHAADAREYGIYPSTGREYASEFNKAHRELATLGGGELFVPFGRYYAASLITHGNGVTAVGAGSKSTTIVAAPGSTHEYMWRADGLTSVGLKNIGFDANQANRIGSIATTDRLCAVGLFTTSDGVIDDLALTGTVGGTGNASATALTIGGGSRWMLARIKPTAIGITGRPSDGVYVTADDALILGGIADQVTDTAFVLESCNRSGIIGIQVYRSSVVASITNIANVDKGGNYLIGLTSSDWNSSVTGGIQVGCPLATSTGYLYDTILSNVIMRKDTVATGPAINVRRTGAARTIGLDLVNVRARDGSAQGLLVVAEDVRISQPNLRGFVGTPIQVQPNADDVSIEAPRIKCSATSVYGIYSDSVSELHITDPDITGGAATTHNIYHDNAATNVSTTGRLRLRTASTALIGSAGGTTPEVNGWLGGAYVQGSALTSRVSSTGGGNLSALTVALGGGTGVVSVDAVDTAGVGFRRLRVPN